MSWLSSLCQWSFASRQIVVATPQGGRYKQHWWAWPKACWFCSRTYSQFQIIDDTQLDILYLSKPELPSLANTGLVKDGTNMPTTLLQPACVFLAMNIHRFCICVLHLSHTWQTVVSPGQGYWVCQVSDGSASVSFGLERLKRECRDCSERHC